MIKVEIQSGVQTQVEGQDQDQDKDQHQDQDQDLDLEYILLGEVDKSPIEKHY